ncbi:hypothetical protein B1J93_21140 [Leptospira kirschneri serovar Pomona]|uniref:Uncharacterized protein n=1 Tax=Leptospira kirschneri serovar Pomona TaxID=561005 RepID=A0A1T1DGQ2_9LEPT|nr:hypothetical protein B1J93_21140 [Leptospira kirschneri serovar Pomona]
MQGNLAKRSLKFSVAFYIEIKVYCCILFSAYNLLIRAESPVRLAFGKLDLSDFLTSNSRYIKIFKYFF